MKDIQILAPNSKEFAKLEKHLENLQENFSINIKSALKNLQYDMHFAYKLRIELTEVDIPRYELQIKHGFVDKMVPSLSGTKQLWLYTQDNGFIEIRFENDIKPLTFLFRNKII